jgi:hypothetical protein
MLGEGTINSVQMFKIGHIQRVLAPDGRAIMTLAATESTLNQSGMT